MITRTVTELAELCGASVEGQGDRVVHGPAALADATAEDVSFLGNPKYVAQLETTAAGAVVVAHDVKSERSDLTLLRCDDPNKAFGRIIEVFRPQAALPATGVHATAVLEEGVAQGANVSIGAGSFVGRDVELADDVVLHTGVTVGAGSSIGKGTVLHPSVVVYPGTRIGARCIVHAGTVIGSDGFGFEPTAEGWAKIQQLGYVAIEDDVEIGANCAIDRGRFGPTRILRMSKLDNLVHVAHNCVVGPAALLIAQVGIAGSSKIRERAILAGQSGCNGHTEVGPGARIAGGAAVMQDVEGGKDYWGNPAIDMKTYFRSYKHFSKLDQLVKRVRGLEKRLAELETNGATPVQEDA